MAKKKNIANPTNTRHLLFLVHRVKPAVPVQQMVPLNLRGRDQVINKQNLHREIGCKVCQNGWRKLQKIWRTQNFPPLAVTEPVLQNHLVQLPYLPVVQMGNTTYKRIFPRTRIARSACGPRFYDLRADTILKTTYSRAKFGDLITAAHPVLNKEGESRNNHWNAIVVQALATQ